MRLAQTLGDPPWQIHAGGYYDQPVIEYEAVRIFKFEAAEAKKRRKQKESLR